MAQWHETTYKYEETKFEIFSLLGCYTTLIVS